MHVSTGRSSALSKRANNLARADGLTVYRTDHGQVAIEDAHVGVHDDHDEISSAIWINSRVRDAGAYGMNCSSNGRREVDTGVDVPTWTERVVWLELKCRAAKALADHRPGYNAIERQALVARDLRCRDNPNDRTAGDESDDP
jgi:hypothetical protein